MRRLTVFTPTYNRAHTLPRLYASLLVQSVDSFEWHIVDDGSTDATEALIRSWQSSAPFPIKYTFQENAGKARAHNAGVLGTSLELFMCVDSDDHLAPDAVARIVSVVGDCDDPQCVGLLAYKGVSDTEPLTPVRFSMVTHSTLRDQYDRGFFGDTALVYRSEVLKNFLFPTFPGETFVTENIVYAQIDEHFYLHLLHKVLIVCEYQTQGLSSSPLVLKRDNPLGFAAYYLVLSRTNRGIRSTRFLAQSVCYSILSGREYRSRYCGMFVPYLLAWPAGLMLSQRRRRQYRRLDRKQT